MCQPVRARVGGLAVALLAVVLATVSSGPAAASYPPKPPVPRERSIDVSAFSPVCIADAPYIEYAIVPIGFDTDGPARLTIRDSNGAVVEVLDVATLTGRIPYPGAEVGSDGTAIDWPGWKFDGGQWSPDGADVHLRVGIGITVEANSTAVATVEYPDAASDCAGPDVVQSAAAGGPSQASAGMLPSTGSNSSALLIGATALTAGILLAGFARWRRNRQPVGA